MQENLKAFTDQIFSINPTVSTVYGSALTVGSRDMAGGGINNSASDVILKLKSETASLADVIAKSGADRSAVETTANNIEGCLLTLQTIGQISDKFCNSLITELHDIVGK